MSRCQDESEPVQPRATIGRPRGDARVLAVLDAHAWMKGEVVAERLGLSLGAAYAALWRAEQRGLIEHRRNQGYRLKEQRS